MTKTVETTRFGAIDVENSSVIEFPEGLLGFGECKRYVLLDHPGGNGPFEWLQSTERPEIAFCVIDPVQFKPDYRIAVKQHELAGIRIKSIEDGVVRVILVIPFLFMGSLLLESFFGIPGLGAITVDAIQGNDFSVLRTMVYIGSLLFVFGQILTDLSYGLVDPRVRLE